MTTAYMADGSSTVCEFRVQHHSVDVDDLVGERCSRHSGDQVGVDDVASSQSVGFTHDSLYKVVGQCYAIDQQVVQQLDHVGLMTSIEFFIMQAL